MSVKRYDPRVLRHPVDNIPYAGMAVRAEGYFVLHSDYEAMKTERDALAQTFAETCAELGCAQDNEAVLMAIHALRTEREELARAVAKHVRWHHMVDEPRRNGTHRCMGCWAPAWQDDTDEDNTKWSMQCAHLPGCPVVLAGQVLREEAEDEADRD